MVSIVRGCGNWVKEYPCQTIGGVTIMGSALSFIYSVAMLCFRSWQYDTCSCAPRWFAPPFEIQTSGACAGLDQDQTARICLISKNQGIWWLAFLISLIVLCITTGLTVKVIATQGRAAPAAAPADVPLISREEEPEPSNNAEYFEARDALE